MKETMYVIATRGRQGREVYLAYDEERASKSKDPYKLFFKWTENINEAYALFHDWELEDWAKEYFKNFNKWYVKGFQAIFS